MTCVAKTSATLACVLLTATCQTLAPVSPPGDATLLARCGADRWISLIGEPVTALPATGHPGTLRLLRPGDPVTEDYSETRLNVMLDGRDRITALSCG